MSMTATKVRDWESVFSTWAQGPSKTEQEKAENAERQIYQAIQNSPLLKHRDIKVFTQGSYNDDNIKALVRKHEAPAEYTYAQFKHELHLALVARFGVDNVTRGDKAFQIDENSYCVNADVAAFFEHRRYYSSSQYQSGVQMLTDKGNSLINWPEQHYTNGVGKNKRTGRRYKRGTRILKTLRNEMAAAGISAADPIPSFLVECLVWNAPDSAFNRDTYKAMMRAILANLYNDTRTGETCSEWGEVSELKYLFRGTQPWTRAQAHAFISAAWDFIGYE